MGGCDLNVTLKWRRAVSEGSGLNETTNHVLWHNLARGGRSTRSQILFIHPVQEIRAKDCEHAGDGVTIHICRAKNKYNYWGAYGDYNNGSITLHSI